MFFFCLEPKIVLLICLKILHIFILCMYDKKGSIEVVLAKKIY